MNTHEAKKILSLYRPGTADAEDASFCEALTLCNGDPELKRWFDDHCAAYAAIRAKFRSITVPEGLREQILSERKVHTTPVWRRPVALVAVAAIAILISFAAIWMQPRQPDFADYRTRMASVALRTYGMNLRSADVEQIRAYLAKTDAPSDYTLPGGIQNAVAIGCAHLKWENHPVSMICFKSGKPLPPGQSNDIWLFVIRDSAVPNPPAESGIAFAKVNRLATASWTHGGDTYILAADGDQDFLRKYL